MDNKLSKNCYVAGFNGHAFATNYLGQRVFAILQDGLAASDIVDLLGVEGYNVNIDEVV